MLLRSIRSQYVDPELPHDLLLTNAHESISITDSGRTLLATVKSGTPVISFLNDSSLINLLLSHLGSSPNLTPSLHVTARLTKISSHPVLLLNAPAEPKLLAAVLAISDLVVLSESPSAALLAQTEQLACGKLPGDLPSLVSRGVIGNFSLFESEISYFEISDLSRVLGARSARWPGVSVVLFFEKIVSAVNLGRGNLFALGRATLAEATDKAAFWTRKILARERRKAEERLPVSDIADLTDLINDLAVKEWRKWAPLPVEISQEISDTISDLRDLNVRVADVHNQAVLNLFARQLRDVGNFNLAMFTQAVGNFRGHPDTVHVLQHELVRLVLEFADSDEKLGRLAADHADVLGRMHAEAAKSAAVMSQAQATIAAYVLEVDALKAELAQSREEADARAHQFAIDLELAKTQISALISEAKIAQDAKTHYQAQLAQCLNHKNVLEAEKSAVTCLQAELAAERQAAFEAAASPKGDPELLLTMAALEAQLAETREALAEEHRRCEALMRRSELQTVSTRRGFFSCLRPQISK